MGDPLFDKEIYVNFDQNFYKNSAQKLFKPFLDRFQRVLRSYALFNLMFLLFIFFEITYFFVHLTFLAQSFVVAIYVALIFATVFCYFTLRVYFQTNKAEKLVFLKSDFEHACRSIIPESESEVESHLFLAHAYCQMASELHGLEYDIYVCPNWCHYLSASIEKLNCYCFWKDVHFIKELFLNICVNEHIAVVKAEPTNLEAHAALANAYVMLSGLYVDPREIDGMDDDKWIPSQKYGEDFKTKFRATAEKAIEEFKILSDYAPQDPWVHTQLAYSYRDLQMPKEEISEYETLLLICPDDNEVLFKLGKLYFEQGQNAKGLKMYEALKASNYKKAESLISYYGKKV